MGDGSALGARLGKAAELGAVGRAAEGDALGAAPPPLDAEQLAKRATASIMCKRRITPKVCSLKVASVPSDRPGQLLVNILPGNLGHRGTNTDSA